MSKARRELRADGEATRARILEAAGELFAARGFAEATNKAIATRAGVDLASINYHFGNRGTLYESVLIEAHHRLLDLTALQSLADSDASARDKLRQLVEQLAELSGEDSQTWHARAMARELLAPSSHLEVLLEAAVLPKMQLVKRLLAEVAGIPESAPALARCLLSVGAPCLMLLVGGRMYPRALQDTLQISADGMAEHLYRFALGGLEAVGAAYRQQAGA